MRILFAVPRSYNPKQMYREYPLGAGFLATLLKQHGHEVRIFDQNVEGDDNLFYNIVDGFEPHVVGFSVITPNYPVARLQIRHLKASRPDIRIIAGGLHASLFPEDLLADGVDVVAQGEGEPIISELISALEQGGDLRALTGLIYRNAAGEIVRTASRPKPIDLDSLPLINRNVYNLPRYAHHSMLASRGCPHHCAFCCNFTGTVRNGVAVRWHENVVHEMEYLRDCHGAREIFFADDIFLLRKADILKFCDLVRQRNVGLRWISQMRADRIDDTVAAAMASGGCQRIYFGVESGSDQILADAKKGMTMAQIEQGISAAMKAGLRVKTGWIYGLPGSLEEQYKSIDFMLRLRPHEISIHQLIPFPGTVYYSEPEKFGIRIADPKAFDSFCYGGIDGNIRFDYLDQSQLVQLLEDTGAALEREGYVSSDKARPDSRYIYTTPLSKNSMNVFRPPTPVS